MILGQFWYKKNKYLKYLPNVETLSKFDIKCNGMAASHYFVHRVTVSMPSALGYTVKGNSFNTFSITQLNPLVN